MSSDTPIRLTKQRAIALLDFAELGIASERDSITERFGVHFQPDGTLDLDDGFELSDDPDEVEELSSRLGLISDAFKAYEIVRRRYVG